jgi:hypothetical protein
MILVKQDSEVVNGRSDYIEDIRIIVSEYANDIKRTYTIRDFSSYIFRNESEPLFQTNSLKFIERSSIVDALNKNDSLELEFEIGYVQGLKRYTINFIRNNEKI